MPQDIHAELKRVVLSGSGKAHTDQLVGMLDQKPGLFDDLVSLYLTNEEPVSRRAVWAVDYFSEKHPGYLLPYIESITEHLPRFVHNGLKRHSLRMLARSPLPEKNLALLMNHCFDFLTSQIEPPAVKVHAMEILYRISCREPDMKRELADSIEWRIREESDGFRSRASRILKKLYQEMR
jgi:hypothetical protein